MIVPKRAAILLDRIMVALHHALEDGDQEGVRRINELYKNTKGSQKVPHEIQSKFVSRLSSNGINNFLNKINCNLNIFLS